MEQDLAHVADVEQSGAFTHPKVLGHDALVLDGHFVAGERDHSTTMVAVPFVERELLQLGLGKTRATPRIAAEWLASRLGLVGWAVVDFSAHRGAPVATAARNHPVRRRRPRLSRDLRAFAGEPAYPFGGPPLSRRTLSRLSGARGPFA